MEELLEESLARLECLKDCHLESALEYPDFVFALESVTENSLEQVRLVLAKEKALHRLDLAKVEELVEVLEPWAKEKE
jgi:hypothetical protein